ncbi:hypothetical protein T4E_817 [Trichinella pseudospiralis]|uniref:Uncharacterized protein n=1 Tax=Trichinella pseudospiralis TaxID=6337 RepID=A0A0V0Y251_TRIPS|nr:hypothetical protein T4E_817 [Trichinella pseudospiralis]
MCVALAREQLLQQFEQGVERELVRRGALFRLRGQLGQEDDEILVTVQQTGSVLQFRVAAAQQQLAEQVRCVRAAGELRVEVTAQSGRLVAEVRVRHAHVEELVHHCRQVVLRTHAAVQLAGNLPGDQFVLGWLHVQLREPVDQLPQKILHHVRLFHGDRLRRGGRWRCRRCRRRRRRRQTRLSCTTNRARLFLSHRQRYKLRRVQAPLERRARR